MGEIAEGLGGAIEGGLLSKSIEDERGDARGGSKWEGNCLNCGTELIGPHCHSCGQRYAVHRSLSAIAHDLVHGVLHLDGKLWRTLPLLAFKPGDLTKRYIAGERVKFVSPMAMFLFSVFLMFALFQAMGLTTPVDLPGAKDTQAKLSQLEATTREAFEDQRQEVAKLPPGSSQYREAKAKLDKSEKYVLDKLRKASSLEQEHKVNAQANLTGIKSIDQKLLKKWLTNPSLMLYKLQSSAYKFSWLLIPLSIPFVWLLFAWDRRFAAYDHAVFVTYSLAFMSLLFIALSLLAFSRIGGGWIFAPLAIIPPLHIYKQLRNGYQLSRFSAFWRLMALSLFIWIVLILFLDLLLLIGAL